ncbi:MAG TPA: F0F1 ATP synthase subunit A [Patescibacteria group bacterium]|jgi:F-type H+-transporting ATPase subunit a|nr:F0F1 ATP synthase subunit A [Patescibacteria group bacterium]
MAIITQTLFAAETIPLAAQPINQIGPFVLTNSMFFGAITAVFVVLLFTLAMHRSSLWPRSKFAFAIESLTEFILNIAEENFGSRKVAIKHLPLLLTLFTFIFVSNISGLLPGVDSIVVHTPNGTVSLFRAFTTDLNGTLSLGLLTICLVQFYALSELGFLGHFKHYFTAKPWNPMNLFIGLIEVMGEFIRIMTLSMRLFGVIYAGEVLLTVVGSLAGNFGWAATIPIYFMEIFFSAIQAYIFVMLTTVYLSIAIRHEDAEGHDIDHPSVPEPVKVAEG